jgi:transposase
MARQAYPSDVSDEEWALVAPYLTLMTVDAPQREHSLREVFKGLRWMVRAGAAWRMMPHDLPPWHTVYQQSHRWLKAGVFDTSVQELRAVLRVAQGRKPEPSAAIFESRTLPSTPASGPRTAASEQDRSQVTALAATVQEGTGDAVEVAFVDQGYTGEQAAEDAQAQHMRLDVVKLPEAKKGFVLLPRRWVVERSNAWAARFRRLARDDERLAETLAGLHFVAFAILMLKRFVALLLQNA